MIDACIRKDSRTRRLAKAVLDTMDGDVETVICSEVKPITEEDYLGQREREAMNDSGDAILLAKQFAAADTIVIAAPFWDLSFPTILKAYLEQINVVPITFEYTELGIPKGNCNCQKLIYVTTAGGYIFAEEYGYGYVRALAEQFYGIPEVELVKAEGLDIVGADVEEILQEAIESINAKAKKRRNAMNLEETMQAIKEADDNTLFILWTNADPVAANLMVFMYAENSMKYQKWDAITIIVWGATTKLVAEDPTIQERIKKLQDLGVHFTACITCAEELGVTEEIRSLGIDLVKWLNPLTELLKENKKLLTV